MSLENALGQEQLKQVGIFRKSHPSCHAVEGVVRLGVTVDECAEIIRTYEWSKQYACAFESETGDDHIHWVIYNPKKKIPISGVRKHFQAGIAELGKAPKAYLNGMLNISRVEDSFAMLAYTLKEQEKLKEGEDVVKTSVPDLKRDRYVCHGLYIADIRLAMKVSYKKISGFAKKVRELYLAVSHQQLEPWQALSMYRQFRNSALSPETNVMKMAKAFLEISKKADELDSDSKRVIELLVEQEFRN